MTDDIQSPADEQPAEDDLSATIAAAIKESEDDESASEDASDDTPDADDSEPDKAETEPDPDGDKEPSEKAASTESKEGADPDEKTGDDEPDQPDGEDDPAAQPAIDPPARYSEKDKETFRSLPREAQDFVVKRNQETDADYTRKTQELAEHRKAAEGFGTAVEPYRAYLASKGVSPIQAFQTLIAAEYQLTTGTPEQKTKIMAQLARDYGVNPDDLSELSEGEPPSPEITQLQQRQAALERQVQGERAQVQTQLTRGIETQVATFAEEKDTSGNLTHPHFAEVRAAMGAFINLHPDTDMQTAYDNAVWAYPELREANLTQQRQAAEQDVKRQQGEADKKAEQERKVKAKKAKKAASGVKAGAEPPGPGTDTKEMSLRDQIAEEYEAASSL